MADTPPPPSGCGPSAAAPAGTITACPLANLYVQVRRDTEGGDPIKGASVDVSGPEQHSGTTDDAGNIAFLHVQPGIYSVKAGAKTYLPRPAARSANPPAGGEQTVTLVLAQPIVVAIGARSEGTHGIRNKDNHRRNDNILPTSLVDQGDLSQNKPVVLIRGCKPVRLEASTSPPGLPVQWEIHPNQNKRKPPAIKATDGGRSAILQTDVTGSFSIIASLRGKRIVWNVVFVDVRPIPASTDVECAAAGYRDNGSIMIQTPERQVERTTFRSGYFTAPPAQVDRAWLASVTVVLTGGGTDDMMGLEYVDLHILQNGVADTLTGYYGGVDSCEDVPRGGLPALDASDSKSPFAGACSKLEKIDDRSRLLTVWDSPAAGFDRDHATTFRELDRISGGIDFVTCVASQSKCAANTYMVHAKIAWTADFSGTVHRGYYLADGAQTVSEYRYQLISPDTGGQDADLAGMETTGPIFLGEPEFRWVP